MFDGVGGAIGAAALSVIRSGGTFCPFGAAAGEGVLASTADAGRADVHTVTAGALDVPRQVELAAEALARAMSGQLRATIGQVFDLTDAASAHAAMESRSTIGKTLLRVR